MTSSGGGPLEFHNIQEIVDIELMFELICMLLFFFLSFYPQSKLSEKRKLTIKQEKVLNHYYITILYSSKTHVNSSLLFDQFISNIPLATALLWTLRPRSPLPPPSLLGKGSK